MIIEMKEICFSYEDKKQVIKDMDFYVKEHEFLGVLGASGCGKTTLLKCICGLLKPDHGSILYNQENFRTWTKEQIEEIRKREIGIVMQDFALISCLSVRENIALSLEINQIYGEEALELTDLFLKQFQLSELQNKMPDALSGGEKQRTAIARAFIKNPKILLADEPTGNLDRKNARNVLELFLKGKQTTSVVMVTHDLYAASFCDRVVFFEDGKVKSIYEKKQRNRKEFLAELLFSVNEEEML